MKKLFLSALLLASAGIAITSCNNGEYDTDPKTNNSNIKNPMNTSNGGGYGTCVCQEPLSAKINDSVYVADTANYAIQTGTPVGDVLVISGPGAFNGNAFVNLGISIIGYSGAKTYSGSNVAIGSWQIGTDASTIHTSSMPGGSCSVTIIGDANNIIEGKFYFTAKNPAGASVTVNGGYFKAHKL